MCEGPYSQASFKSKAAEDLKAQPPAAPQRLGVADAPVRVPREGAEEDAEVRPRDDGEDAVAVGPLTRLG